MLTDNLCELVISHPHWSSEDHSLRLTGTRFQEADVQVRSTGKVWGRNERPFFFEADTLGSEFYFFEKKAICLKFSRKQVDKTFLQLFELLLAVNMFGRNCPSRFFSDIHISIFARVGHNTKRVQVRCAQWMMRAVFS